MLNFNDSIRKTPQKPLVDLSMELAQLKFEVQDPEYSGINAYPFKYLPVMYIVPEKIRGGREGVVMPKGTIVSALTDKTTINYGIPAPAGSGTVPVFVDQNTGSLVYAPIDKTAYGYHESINSLLVPANGGNESTIPYSALDDDMPGWTESTDVPLVLGANIPVGVVGNGIYQDIRGKYLNYNVKEEVYTTIIRGKVNIPYVDNAKLASVLSKQFGTDADVEAVTDTPYHRLWKKNTFLRIASAAEGQAGQLLKSDLYGKYMPQGNDHSTAETAQTIGRILFTDSRFPKDLTGTIQTYPGTTLPGVNTKGLPVELYLFVHETLTALGASPSSQDVLDAVRNGIFGYARILIDV